MTLTSTLPGACPKASAPAIAQAGSAALPCTRLTRCGRGGRPLPADAEAQKIRAAQEPEVTPGVVEPELDVPPSVLQPTAHGDAVARETAAALGGGEITEANVAGVIVRLNRVARPGRQREPGIAEVRPHPLEPGAGPGLGVVRLVELGQQGDAVLALVDQVERRAHPEHDRQVPAGGPKPRRLRRLRYRRPARGGCPRCIRADPRTRRCRH